MKAGALTEHPSSVIRRRSAGRGVPRARRAHADVPAPATPCGAAQPLLVL